MKGFYTITNNKFEFISENLTFSICWSLSKFHSFPVEFLKGFHLPFFLLLHMSFQIHYQPGFFYSLHCIQELALQVVILSKNLALNQSQRIIQALKGILRISLLIFVVPKIIYSLSMHPRLIFILSRFRLEFQIHKMHDTKMEE